MPEAFQLILPYLHPPFLSEYRLMQISLQRIRLLFKGCGFQRHIPRITGGDYQFIFPDSHAAVHQLSPVAAVHGIGQTQDGRQLGNEDAGALC